MPPPTPMAYASATSRLLPDGSWWMAMRQGTPPPRSYSHRTVWPGPLGATMMTFTSSGGLMVWKWMLKPWVNTSVLPPPEAEALSCGAISFS